MVMMLANAGGIGGGAIVVPIIMIFFSFDIKTAVPVSNVLVFVSAFIRFFAAFGEHHPRNAGKLVVDYELVLLLLPTLFLGSLFGVIANSLFPSHAVLVLLCLVLL